jgi:electron transfer flavoprotein beta subunit
MNMIVCIKQVPDPETLHLQFNIDSDAKRFVPSSSVASVINPFDEQALEAALRLKDAHGGKITVLCLGKNIIVDVVKKTLSMGADDLILLQDDFFEEGDSLATAQVLTAAIQKIREYDLIFCGRQASDTDAGLVGINIAELLSIPCITTARKVELSDDLIRVERVIEDGYEVIEAALPVLITVSNELGEARYPTLRAIMAAKRIQPIIWNNDDLNIESTLMGSNGSRDKVLKLFIPAKKNHCEFIEGEDPGDSGDKLALKLKETKLL